MKNVNLKIARLKMQKSQYLLSYETGIAQSLLSLIEQGLRNPKGDEAEKIAKALNANLSDVFPDDVCG